MDAITLTYQMDAREYLRGCDRLWHARNQGSAVNLGIGAAAIAAGLLLWSEFGWIAMSLMAVGALLVLLVSMRWLLWWRSFRNARKFQNPMELTFSEAGIGVVTVDGETTLGWSFYKDYLDVDEFFVLCADKRIFSVIPKRAVPSESIIRLTDLIAGKLQKL